MKKMIAMLLALVMALSLMACGSTNANNGGNDNANTGDDAQPEAKTTLVVGVSADYAPFEFMYPDAGGNMVYGGIDISVAQYVADEMGLTMQVENMSFDNLLASLDKGDFDIVLSAMEATPERLENADFSDPYYTDVPPAILVKADKADQYKTLADFSGKYVGAQTATTKLDMVNDMEGVTPVPLSSVLELVNELVYDKVDAILVDGGVAQQYADANPDLVIAEASSELGEAAPYCIAVAKGDPKGLLDGINAAIAKMTAENKIETFLADADSLADVAVEVSAD
jgi:polar amino acid transport system substrate-binding protein